MAAPMGGSALAEVSRMVREAGEEAGVFRPSLTPRLMLPETAAILAERINDDPTGDHVAHVETDPAGSALSVVALYRPGGALAGYLRRSLLAGLLLLSASCATLDATGTPDMDARRAAVRAAGCTTDEVCAWAHGVDLDGSTLSREAIIRLDSILSHQDGTR